MSSPVSGPPALTVVVCTFNRSAKLGGVLAALDQQSSRDRLEVVVVDDGSSDDTQQVLREFDWIRVVTHEQNRGLAAARSTGLSQARADWVAYTDDDCRPAADWAAELLELADRHPNAFAVGGPVAAQPTSGLINDFLLVKPPFAPLELSLLESGGFWHRLREYLRRSAAAPSGNEAERAVASLAGANMAVNKRRCLELGAWDETFVFGGEEQELFLRALGQGFEIVYGPSPRVSHVFEDTLTDLVRRSFLYGRGNERLQAKHGGLPTLYPVPVLSAAAIGWAAVGRRAPWVLAALLLPQAVFSNWPLISFRQQRLQPLLYPYLQTLQETASNAGWVAARVRRIVRTRARRRAGADG